MAKVNEQQTKTPDLQAKVEDMYSRALRVAEVDNLLENTSVLQLAYRSMYGGLDIFDYDAPMHNGPLLSFTGRGALDTVESVKLQEFLAHSGNAAIVYELFETGLLTLEKGEIKQQLAAENLGKQKNARLNKSQGNI